MEWIGFGGKQEKTKKAAILQPFLFSMGDLEIVTHFKVDTAPKGVVKP